MKIGDRVLITKKMIKYFNGDYTGWVSSMDRNIGLLGIIQDIEKRSFIKYKVFVPKGNNMNTNLKEEGFWYPAESLVLESEDKRNDQDIWFAPAGFKKGKLQTKSNITLKNIWPYLCDEWKNQIIKDFGNYGWTGQIPEDVALEYEEKMNMKGWLEEKGFVKQKRTFRIGDRFWVFGVNYMISGVGKNEILAINLETGYPLLYKPVKVENKREITEEEAKGLFGFYLRFEDAVWEKDIE
ncbi:MAG: hypothetical protein ACOCP4_00675 [Candidatus Woesearchaeota archaeon]